MIRRDVRRLFSLGLRRPGEVAPEIDEEIAAHLEERARRLEARGLAPEEARAEALRRFGPLPRARAALVREARVRERRLRLRDRVDALRQDFRHAWRSLAAEPFLVAVVALVIALGVGANGAVFGVLDRLLLRGPEHVREPERVARLYFTAEVPGLGPFTTPTFGYVAYSALRDRARAFSAVAALSYSPASTRTLGRGAEAEQIVAADATSDLFPLLGARAALGRFFDAEEDRPGAARRVVVLGHGLWQRRFGGDPAVLGRTVLLEAVPHTVIGVAPRGFTGVELGRVDAWLPMSLRGPGVTEDWQTTLQAQWLEVVMRLAPGVSAEQAGADATRVLRPLLAEADEGLEEGRASTLPLRYDDAGNEAMEVAVSRWLAAVALIVLLVACANVANLLLARALRQRRELAVRAALGVTAGRLLRLLLAQSLLLAACGGLAALAVMPLAARLLRSTLLPHVEWHESPLDARAVLVAALVTLAAGLLTGLAPALAARRADLVAALKAGAREGGGPTSRLRLALTVAQAAFSVVLLVAAGLFASSLWRAESVDLGIEPKRVLMVGARWARDPGDEPEARQRRERAFYARALERARRHPQVETAAIAVGTPFRSRFSVRLRVPGWEELPKLPGGGPNIQAVTAGYLDTVGLRLLRGRDFTDGDREGSEPVALVNQTMAETLWPGREALGACLHVAEREGGGPAPCSRVVGVVEDAHRESIEEPPAMQYYVPLGQEVGIGGSRLLVRPRGDPAALAEPLRAALQPLDPSLLWLQVESLHQGVEPELRPFRLGAVLIGVLGLLALLVAALGLYSLVAHAVASRTRELAVHVALGARRSAVVALVLRGGLGLAVLGLAVGVLLALAVGTRLGGLLFHTSPRDPLVYAAVVATLLLAAATACIAPTRRALRIDPARVLRDE